MCPKLKSISEKGSRKSNLMKHRKQLSTSQINRESLHRALQEASEFLPTKSQKLARPLTRFSSCLGTDDCEISNQPR